MTSGVGKGPKAMPNRKRRDEDEWVRAEKEQAEQAVASSAQQLESVQELAHGAEKVNRRFSFLRRRNMFAEGFRLIIREARHDG